MKSTITFCSYVNKNKGSNNLKLCYFVSGELCTVTDLTLAEFLWNEKQILSCTKNFLILAATCLIVADLGTTCYLICLREDWSVHVKEYIILMRQPKSSEKIFWLRRCESVYIYEHTIMTYFSILFLLFVLRIAVNCKSSLPRWND